MLILDDNWKQFFSYANLKPTSCKKGYYYFKPRIGGGKRLVESLHRLIADPRPGFEVDHINTNPSDNRSSNLREATRQQNAMNVQRTANKTSGFKGVSWDAKNELWYAYIKKGGKMKNLGRFAKLKDAKVARLDAEQVWFGDFARKKDILDQD